MATNKINWFEVLFWVILIVLIILILTRIFGKSATDIQIYITIVMGMLAIMGYIVKMNREIGEIKIEMRHMSAGIKESFDRLKEEMGLIKKKLKI